MEGAYRNDSHRFGNANNIIIKCNAWLFALFDLAVADCPEDQSIVIDFCELLHLDYGS